MAIECNAPAWNEVQVVRAGLRAGAGFGIHLGEQGEGPGCLSEQSVIIMAVHPFKGHVLGKRTNCLLVGGRTVMWEEGLSYESCNSDYGSADDDDDNDGDGDDDSDDDNDGDGDDDSDDDNDDGYDEAR
eukprot:1144128-Pelagomonas_calceolata.AAC.7